MNNVNITEIDPLLELVDDPVTLIKSKYYATDSQKVLRARKEAYSQGFETAMKVNRTYVWLNGYNACAADLLKS